jgi:hypothetical protein
VSLVHSAAAVAPLVGRAGLELLHVGPVGLPLARADLCQRGQGEHCRRPRGRLARALTGRPDGVWLALTSQPADSPASTLPYTPQLVVRERRGAAGHPGRAPAGLGRGLSRGGVKRSGRARRAGGVAASPRDGRRALAAQGCRYPAAATTRLVATAPLGPSTSPVHFKPWFGQDRPPVRASSAPLLCKSPAAKRVPPAPPALAPH